MFMHDKIRIGIFASAVGVLAGCSMFSGPLEGTWLVSWDRSSVQEVSSCSDDDTASSTTYDGDDNQWMDIYYTDDGGIVVSSNAEDLVGTTSGKTFSVESNYREDTRFSSSAYSYFEWVFEMSGELSDSELSGETDYKAVNGNQSGECRLQAKQEFSAVKVKAVDRATRTVGGADAGE
jgi:hypothetical protein